MTVEEYIERLYLTHFRPSEFLVGCNKPPNTLPPPEFWGNIALTAIILDSLREHFGRAIVITSCWRHWRYNNTITGASKLSQHQGFCAVDFGVAGISPHIVGETLQGWKGRYFLLPPITQEFRRVQVKLPSGMRLPYEDLEYRDGAAKFAGGVGVYNTFTHLDTRGINKMWKGGA